MTPNLDQLKNHVDRLHHLLKDPHPGFVGWNICYVDVMKAINKFWQDSQKPKSSGPFPCEETQIGKLEACSLGAKDRFKWTCDKCGNHGVIQTDAIAASKDPIASALQVTLDALGEHRKAYMKMELVCPHVPEISREL